MEYYQISKSFREGGKIRMTEPYTPACQAYHPNGQCEIQNIQKLKAKLWGVCMKLWFLCLAFVNLVLELWFGALNFDMCASKLYLYSFEFVTVV